MHILMKPLAIAAMSIAMLVAAKADRTSMLRAMALIAVYDHVCKPGIVEAKTYRLMSAVSQQTSEAERAAMGAEVMTSLRTNGKIAFCAATELLDIESEIKRLNESAARVVP